MVYFIPHASLLKVKNGIPLSPVVHLNKIGFIVIFFANNTLKIGKKKLFKLMYFADFLHFRQTGKSLSGYEYKAWARGPVPTGFNKDLIVHKTTLNKYFVTKKEYYNNSMWRLDIVPQKEFNPDLFTERELKILKNVSKYFSNFTGKEIEKFSYKTIPFIEGKRKRDFIDYNDVLENNDDFFKGYSLSVEEVEKRKHNSNRLQRFFN